MFSALALWATPSISTVTGSAASVGKYSKIEFVVGLTRAYTNPYDPDQIDLSATFTAPSGATWKIYGFYGVDAANNSSWRIRFAPDEVGNCGRTLPRRQPLPERPPALRDHLRALPQAITAGLDRRE